MSYSRQSRKGFFNSITLGLFCYAGLGTKDLIQLNNWNVAVYIGFYLIQDILVPIAQHPAPCCRMNCILCKLSIKEESKHICILFGSHATDWMLPKCAEILFCGVRLGAVHELELVMQQKWHIFDKYFHLFKAVNPKIKWKHFDALGHI